LKAAAGGRIIPCSRAFGGLVLQSEGHTSGISPDAGSTLGIADRRAHPRQPVSSIAYVELGGDNGGIVLNVSEGGLALAAVAVMDVEGIPRVRIQLPRSRDWTEINSQITWIGESKKDAGIRFLDLTDELRDRIKNWISMEVAARESPRNDREVSRKAVPLPPAPKPQEVAPPAPELPTLDFPLPLDPAPPDLAGVEPVLHLLSSATAEHSSVQEESPVTHAIEQHSEEIPAKGGSAEPPPQSSDRRAHVRRQVKLLSYVGLGEYNGGIILNSSEDGLHVQAACALTSDHIPLMRFQLPQSADWIEAGGKVVWMSESKKEARIQFIDLPEGDRAKLREWVATGAPTPEGQPAQTPVREEIAPALDTAGTVESAQSETPAPEPVILAHSVEPQPMVAAAVPISVSPEPQPPADIPIPLPPPSRRMPGGAGASQTRPARKPLLAWLNLSLSRRAWQTIVASIAVLVAISFSIGWFAARLSTQNGVPAPSVIKEETHSDAAKIPPPPARDIAQASSSTAEKPRTAGRDAALSAVPNQSRAVNSAADTARSASATAAHPPASPATSAARKIALPTPETAAVQPVAPSPQPSSTPVPVESAPSVPVLAKENLAPAPKEPEIAFIPEGSVSVTFPPFPSIRVPVDMKFQPPKLGTSLQLGQLISRAAPVPYPEEFRRQRIEGTVKLHAIIGKDGAIQSVSLLSGPQLLAAPAINAILEWRFKPTFLGGQAVETEEDITVVFHLQNSQPHSN